MSEPLRIGLLQCGRIHDELSGDHGDYPEVFAELLGPHGIEIVAYDAVAGELPGSPADHDGWLVSGSASSTYDPDPWIAPLEDLLRDLVRTASPTVAVCFGHQLLAQALGGRVEKAPVGWGVGAHAYEVVGATADWMDPPARVVRLIASHQDQVVELPADAVVVARTDHCPIAAFTVGETALAIQPHPEFTAELSLGLTGIRRSDIGEDRADVALASLDDALDRDVVAAWMANFLRR
jgi:GMP synthase-like glutamine amidotransferase